MPKWICPYCSASHNVTDKHLGKAEKCQKCGRTSEVRDSDAIADEEQIEFTGVLPRIQPSTTALHPAMNGVSTTHTAKILLLGIVGVWVLLLLVSLALEDGRPLFQLAVTALVFLTAELILVWPFYTACDDLRAVRTLLEKQHTP